MNKTKTAKIRDICSLKAGTAFRSKIIDNPHGHTPVVQPKDIASNGILLHNNTYKIFLPAIKEAQYLKPNDVLFATRGRLATTVFPASMQEKYIASGAILILTPTDERIQSAYLALYFNSKMGQQLFRKLTKQSTVPFISRATIEELELPIPSLEKQQQLIDLENRRQQLNSLMNRKTEILSNIMTYVLKNT